METKIYGTHSKLKYCGSWRLKEGKGNSLYTGNNKHRRHDITKTIGQTQGTQILRSTNTTSRILHNTTKGRLRVGMAYVNQVNVGYARLAEALRDIDALCGIEGVLTWDELVMLPDKAAESRAAQKAALAEVLHRKQTSKHLENLIVCAEKELPELNEMERATVRDARRNFDHKVKIPSELARREARLSSEGYQIWAKARANNDFESFTPVLEKLIQLRHDEANAVSPEKSPYNFCIDKFERGMEASRLKDVFDELKKGLVPLIHKVASAPQLKIHPKLQPGGKNSFSIDKQELLCSSTAEKLGFQGLLNKSLHPFTGGVGPTDVRITTRYAEDDFVSGLLGLIHETGHALYEQNRPSGPYNGLPVSEALSMGIHESQSLLFERMVGQSDEFWKFMQPHILKEFDFVNDVAPQDYYVAVNKVEKSLIRVDADELTYPLHIIIRFEIEQGLFDGSIAVKDLPKVWNQKMKDYLDVEVPSDEKGCLQDVHWSDGSFGYFPSYTLGAMYAAQFFKYAQEQVPTLHSDIARGDFSTLQAWLKENVHSRGSLYPSADELCLKVTGEKLNPRIFLNYLEDKYSRLYNLDQP